MKLKKLLMFITSVHFARAILLAAAIMAAWQALELSEAEIKNLINKERYRYFKTVATGLENASLGFSIISAFCLLGYSLTYLNQNK